MDYLHVAQLTKAGLDTSTIGRQLGLHPDLVIEFQELEQRTSGATQLADSLPGRLLNGHPLPLAGDDACSLFLAELQSQHGFSPAKAHSYLVLLEELAAENLAQERPPEAVVYYAVADHEPPGKALSECEFVPVQVSYYSEGPRDSHPGYFSYV
ncbi:Uncharacterized [Moorella glycerini]|uniref:Uncharacterized protein n=1 Tax=Neomoorella stamsii TaxID=1266720 RepID=A0A9X7J5U1_9FIRM|nr:MULTISPECIES: hypothetical protein [Moorella]PRR77179.1 hypothetical protein MOST_03070 [Moorella stamsii]CEP67245.1 Uncharacterized [Moorella glycerini]